MIETEIVFGGDGSGKADPSTKIDTTVEDSMADYNITHVSITRGTYHDVVYNYIRQYNIT